MKKPNNDKTRDGLSPLPSPNCSHPLVAVAQEMIKVYREASNKPEQPKYIFGLRQIIYDTLCEIPEELRPDAPIECAV